ncbi:hypothetical protein PPYR_04011 [Photinus pyralis]|uniref:C2 domain-containing protein n=1 Tax=Photinus pyralis TaxID=7054 RepID=A0A5N4AWU1_PHOPY|nr:hypothetical protein PPYR_04011 [Photinus pyralis]
MSGEDAFWKTISDKLKRHKSVVEKDHEQKLQEVDGSFFERFGSILHERSESEKKRDYQNHVRATKASVRFLPRAFLHQDHEEPQLPEPPPETESEPEIELNQEEINTQIVIKNVNREFSSSLDSEQEESDESHYYTGMNIDELYLDVLYQILHNVGCDVTFELGQTALLSYVQDAFKMSNDKHNQLLMVAQEKEPPELLLNVEIVEAKDLIAKDSNGLSDPFVTLYLQSNSSRRYNSSVKMETLNPVWEEHFALPVMNDSSDDTLFIEVWDFDPAETMREKFGKILKVKGLRGATRLIKEMAVTATTGQHENELIGTARIPLKTIPASGMVMWYSLDKKNKTARQGVIKLHLSFGSEKNSQVAAQEHRYLLNLLLLHELETLQVSPYEWDGKFGSQPEAIITQHRIQSGLCPTEIDFVNWAAYTSVQKEHPLSFELYLKLLMKISKHLSAPTRNEDNFKLFWSFTRKLLPSCIGLIRKVRKRPHDKKTAEQIIDVLNILLQLMCLEQPKEFDLFPSNLYPWLISFEKEQISGISNVLNAAVVKGGKDWLLFILERTEKQDNSVDETLVYFNKVVQIVRSDLQRAVEYDKMFQRIMNFEYAKTLYNLYQLEIANLIEEEVISICKSLKTIAYDWNCLSQPDSHDHMSLGTRLFELYLALQRFVCLSTTLCASYEDGNYRIKDCHTWFQGGVEQWLDIAAIKAMQRIEKAVELDDLSPVDESVKYSSSALDTLTIFHQIRIFWDQLNWPDVESAYSFVAKIIDDLCRCCLFYADKMAAKVDGMGDISDNYEKRFEVTKEWCLAINNIDYVCQSLKPFTEELQLNSLIQQLADIRNPVEAERCNDTLQNVLENALDTIQNKIVELLETVATKMSPAMKKLLIEGAEILHQDNNSIHRVMRYLDNNLATLYGELNEDNFNRILEIIWSNLGNILYDLIHSNIEKRRPPAFFSNLRATLQLMVKSFKHSDENTDSEVLAKIEWLLTVNGMETSELIHQVHIERWTEQFEMKSSPYGELTVRLQFLNTDLKIEIINARNLIPMDSNGFADSFVRICLLPEEKFTNITKPKTQTHNKNLFPLYDETFTLNLTSDQRNLSDGLILFCVKDKDFLGMSNQFIGEAFVHIKDIPSSTGNIKTLPQVHLYLSRPSNLTTDCITALENRHGDKLAKEFLKRLKQKSSGSAIS